ncbi:hypothetical protein AB0F81_38215 [Actinoplanes sp. NPDC024001]|uniref:hypothetical protein n=1 Tax=Actinoplanes sp. NPDC024001 TaxID=3154598 RepID=UPI0033C4F82D
MAVVREFENDDYLPEYGLLVLRDVNVSWSPHDTGPPRDRDSGEEPTGTFAAAGGGWLTCQAGSGHHVVRLELHDSPPAADHDSFDDVAETPYLAGSGGLCLTYLTGGAGGLADLELGAGPYFRVRVARRRGDTPDGAGDRWLLRFWPDPAVSPPVWLVRGAPAVGPGYSGWQAELQYEPMELSGIVAAVARELGRPPTADDVEAWGVAHQRPAGWLDVPMRQPPRPPLTTGHADLDERKAAQHREVTDRLAAEQRRLDEIAAELGVAPVRRKRDALPLLAAAGILRREGPQGYVVGQPARVDTVLSLPPERVRAVMLQDARSRYGGLAEDLRSILRWAPSLPWETSLPSLAERLLVGEGELREVLAFAEQNAQLHASAASPSSSSSAAPWSAGVGSVLWLESGPRPSPPPPTGPASAGPSTGGARPATSGASRPGTPPPTPARPSAASSVPSAPATQPAAPDVSADRSGSSRPGTPPPTPARPSAASSVPSAPAAPDVFADRSGSAGSVEPDASTPAGPAMAAGPTPPASSASAMPPVPVRPAAPESPGGTAMPMKAPVPVNASAPVTPPGSVRPPAPDGPGTSGESATSDATATPSGDQAATVARPAGTERATPGRRRAVPPPGPRQAGEDAPVVEVRGLMARLTFNAPAGARWSMSSRERERDQPPIPPLGAPPRAGILESDGTVVEWRDGARVELARLAPARRWMRALQTACGVLVFGHDQPAQLISADGTVTDVADLRSPGMAWLLGDGRRLAVFDSSHHRLESRYRLRLLDLTGSPAVTMPWPADQPFGVLGVHRDAIFFADPISAGVTMRWTPGTDPEPHPHPLQQIDPLTGTGTIRTREGISVIRPDGASVTVPIDTTARLALGGNQLWTMRSHPPALTLFPIEPGPHVEPQVWWLPEDRRRSPQGTFREPFWEDSSHVLFGYHLWHFPQEPAIGLRLSLTDGTVERLPAAGRPGQSVTFIEPLHVVP